MMQLGSTDKEFKSILISNPFIYDFFFLSQETFGNFFILGALKSPVIYADVSLKIYFTECSMSPFNLETPIFQFRKIFFIYFTD